MSVPCGAYCLPEWELHSIACDTLNRRDPIIAGRAVPDPARERSRAELEEDYRDDRD